MLIVSDYESDEVFYTSFIFLPHFCDAFDLLPNLLSHFAIEYALSVHFWIFCLSHQFFEFNEWLFHFIVFDLLFSLMTLWLEQVNVVHDSQGQSDDFLVLLPINRTWHFRRIFDFFFRSIFGFLVRICSLQVRNNFIEKPFCKAL